MDIVFRTLGWFKRQLENFREEIRTFANFPSLFMGLAKDDGNLAFYDGWLRLVDADGEIVQDHIDPADYEEYIGEAVEPWSYLKSPYYKPLGYPEGIYRVGPLARLNMAKRCGTPLADQELAEFRELERRFVLSSFHYHYARLIEMLFARREDRSATGRSGDPRQARARLCRAEQLEGVGVSEAPRGTLIHHYKIDESGLITYANLIIATGHNNLAMNRGVLQVAKHFVKGRTIPEGMLNRVEAVIRCYDPCLSCSTHAMGQMPLHLQLVDDEGKLLSEVKR